VGATIIYGAPNLFTLELRSEGFGELDLSGLRAGVVSGAPVLDRVAADIRERLVPGLEIAYGLTETSPTVTITQPEDPPGKREGTVGRPLEGVDVIVVGEDGAPVAQEAVGEVAIRGYNVLKGYYRQPDETARAYTPDGFFRTGDLATLDAEGYLRIVGRRKELILRGGFNVQPREVEDLLQTHPAVQHVVVVGVPHEVLGEQVCACVVPVEGALVTGEEIRRFCRRALAEYKIPDLVRFFDVLPMTGSGKVRRAELARLVADEETARRTT
jgi:acyl-CoA synthetase (AMP-forming)/AMP-acid ligase II